MKNVSIIKFIILLLIFQRSYFWSDKSTFPVMGENMDLEYEYSINL